MALARRRRLPHVARFIQQALAPRLLWNAGAQRYVDPATRRFIGATAVRQEIDLEIEASGARLLSHGLALAAGRIDINEFRDLAAFEIKLNEIANYAAARGGFAQLTEADIKAIEARVRRQFRYLERFCRELDARPERTQRKGFLARLRLYAAHGRATYELARRQSHKDAGYGWERNVLHARESCAACLAESARGWLPIGTLRLVGYRTCMSNCKCTIEYRKTRPAEAWESANGGASERSSSPLPEAATAATVPGGVRAVVREQENRIRRRFTESGHVYDQQGNLLLQKQGIGNMIHFTHEERARISNRDAVFTHNHPRAMLYKGSDPRAAGNSFSPEDIEFACDCNLAEMRAVSRKLRFSMRRPASGWSAGYWQNTLRPVYEKHRADVAREMRRAVRKKPQHLPRCDARYFHEIWRRTADELGLDYEREEG